MTGKEWRKAAESLVSNIEGILDLKGASPNIKEGMTIADYRLECESTGRSNAEGKLELIKANLNVFQEFYLSKEHADDFDEYERSIG